MSFKEKPCYYKGSGLVSGSFIRVADGDRQLTQYEVQGFLDGRGQPVYDIEPVPSSTSEDLSKELLQTYLTSIRQKFPKMASWTDEQIMLTTRILVKSEDKTVVTFGRLLALGFHPQSFFPGLTAHVMVCPREKEGLSGDNEERFLDNIKLEGPLLTMVPEIINAIKRNLGRRTFIKGLFREDVMEYPELFFREAVTNALIHRDYSLLARGSAVQVKIFPDRIEMSNPGGLFGPVMEDRLGEQGLQAARNSYLIKILEDCPVPGEKGPLCENRGTGILHMIQALRKSGMEPPTFLDNRTHFRVTCFNSTLFDKETTAWLEKFASIDLSERQRYGLAFIRHRGRLNNREYCRINDCDSREATNELTELVRRGIVKQHGTRRWTLYTLQDEKATTQREIKTRGDRREGILKAIGAKGELSRKEIEQKLAMPSVTVLYWLRRLIKDKSIERTTTAKSPNVRYRLSKGRSKTPSKGDAKI